MRCLLCERPSFSHLCRDCRRERLTPSLQTRKIAGKLPVHSFYAYDEIEPLLLSKHTYLGHYLYGILAKTAFTPFAEGFRCDEEAMAVLPVDDHARHGYSHTALLARALRSACFTPRYARLRDRSGYRYSGRDFQYRLTHPRAFGLAPFPEGSVVLVDDILTTGLTLTQAAEAVEREGKKVRFCLVLADAQRR
jgi:competence protein ComFC